VVAREVAGVVVGAPDDNETGERVMSYLNNDDLRKVIREQMIYISTPRRQGKSMFHKYFEQAAASQSIKDTLAYDDGRRWMGIDPAKCENFIPPCPIAEAAFPAPKPANDHIWDMIVLAARASRYE
jgi:hypothetical protein